MQVNPGNDQQSGGERRRASATPPLAVNNQVHTKLAYNVSQKKSLFHRTWFRSNSKPANSEKSRLPATRSRQDAAPANAKAELSHKKSQASYLKNQWLQFRARSYQKGDPALVLPSPPTESEKYSYIDMKRIWLLPWGVFSFFVLAAGMWLFCIATPVWAWYGLFAVLAQFYLLTSYGVSCLGRSFKLNKHSELIRSGQIDSHAPTVDIYLPVCGEPLEILDNTWKNVERLQYPHGKLKVYVLDDGAQTAVQRLALSYGFNYLCRDDRPHLKKAGNLRWAYARTTGDFFAIFDADFCPRLDFLLETIPYHLADEKIAIVQTPQFFRTTKDQTWVEQGAGSVQEFFYRVVQTTRDSWGAAICVGSNAIYRRQSLEAVGGTAGVGCSEDVQTGFWAVDRGWKVRYLPINLACGICPNSPRALFSQQMRWCMGSSTLLSTKAFYASNLTKKQKLCYISGLLYYTATALAVFMNPLPGPLLLWVRPEFFKYYNVFFALPSLVYGLVILRIWGRSNYNLNVQYVQVIMAYAYVNSIKDRIVGQKTIWAASGDTKAHNNNKYRNMRLVAWAWTIIHTSALVSAVAYRLAKGFPWYEIFPLLLLDAFNLNSVHRFLMFKKDYVG